jgi:hypothetical protein
LVKQKEVKKVTVCLWAEPEAEPFYTTDPAGLVVEQELDSGTMLIDVMLDAAAVRKLANLACFADRSFDDEPEPVQQAPAAEC